MTNITLRVDEELVREAKILAARRGISVSRMIAQELEAMVRLEHRYQAAESRALKRLDEASSLGWSPPATRDELYER